MRSVTVALVALVAGCQIETGISQDVQLDWKSNPPTPDPETVVDEIVQVTQPRVDVLWIIDNSCSMGDDQQALVDNYDAFLDYFKGSGLDWQMGVVSTDLLDQGRLETRVGYRWIDEETPQPLGIFGSMALLGAMGSGCEKGLGTSFEALEMQPYNDGFLRPDAALHSIVISDEADQTNGVPITGDEYVSWYSNLKDRADERSFSAIASLNPLADCTSRPVDYHDVVSAVGGISWDILDTNWRAVLDRLGVQAAGLKREYFMSQRPDAETITVEVETPEGIVHRFDAGEDYVYDPSRNSITFQEYVPGPLSTVRIEYVPLSTGFR